MGFKGTNSVQPYFMLLHFVVNDISKFYTDKESAHPPRNGFSQALESRFLVPKNEAQCA